MLLNGGVRSKTWEELEGGDMGELEGEKGRGQCCNLSMHICLCMMCK